MDFFELATKRRTIRQFSTEEVSRENLEKIIAAGLLAPTPNNSMPWKIAVIADKDLLSKMKGVVEKRLDEIFPNVSGEKKTRLEKVKHFSTIFVEAPVVLAVMAKPYQAMIDEVLKDSGVTHDQMNVWRQHPDIQAAGALVQNMQLAATQLGLGSCWISGAIVASEQIDRLLKGGEYKVKTMLAVGKPKAKPAPKAVVALSEYVTWL